MAPSAGPGKERNQSPLGACQRCQQPQNQELPTMPASLLVFSRYPCTANKEPGDRHGLHAAVGEPCKTTKNQAHGTGCQTRSTASQALAKACAVVGHSCVQQHAIAPHDGDQLEVIQAQPKPGCQQQRPKKTCRPRAVASALCVVKPVAFGQSAGELKMDKAIVQRQRKAACLKPNAAHAIAAQRQSADSKHNQQRGYPRPPATHRADNSRSCQLYNGRCFAGPVTIAQRHGTRHRQLRQPSPASRRRI